MSCDCKDGVQDVSMSTALPSDEKSCKQFAAEQSQQLNDLSQNVGTFLFICFYTLF